MQLDQMTNDRESQSEPALSPGDRSFRLPETIEHVRQKLSRDPSPVSLTVNRAARLNAPQIDTHFSAARSNLIAFDSRFQITCRKRFGSPFTRHSAEMKSGSKLDLLHVRSWTQASTAASTIGVRFKGFRSRRRFPVMMRETSSRSSISRACERALTLDRFHRAQSICAFNFAVANHRRPAENRRQRRAQLV